MTIATEFIKPGAVVWDVGANIGMFSFAASGLAGSGGSVIAIEPDTFLVDSLRRSARLENPGSAPVTVLSCAVSHSQAIATFNIADNGRASNFLTGFGGSQTGYIREQQSVITITLDWLATQLPAPTLLKIDVEGSDLDVLVGAQQLLRESKPVVTVELWERNADPATEFFADLGYTIFDGDVIKGTRLPVTRATFHTLAVPKSLDR